MLPKRYESTNGASVEKKTWLLVISSVKYREELIAKQILDIYYRSDDDIKEVSPLWLMFVFYY